MRRCWAGHDACTALWHSLSDPHLPNMSCLALSSAEGMDAMRQDVKCGAPGMQHQQSALKAALMAPSSHGESKHALHRGTQMGLWLCIEHQVFVTHSVRLCTSAVHGHLGRARDAAHMSTSSLMGSAAKHACMCLHAKMSAVACMRFTTGPHWPRF